MADCPLGFSDDDKRKLDKMYVDMYEGRDKDNLSVTARLAILEEDRDAVMSVRIALFGDEEHEGLVVKFERAIGLVRGSLWAFGITGAVGLLVLSWALSEIVPAAKLVIEDYYSHHPAAKQSLNQPSTQQAHLPQFSDGLGDRYDHTFDRQGNVVPERTAK